MSFLTSKAVIVSHMMSLHTLFCLLPRPGPIIRMKVHNVPSSLKAVFRLGVGIWFTASSRPHPPWEMPSVPFIDSNPCLFRGGAQGQAELARQKNALAGTPARDRASVGGLRGPFQTDAGLPLRPGALLGRAKQRAPALGSDTPGLESQVYRWRALDSLQTCQGLLSYLQTAGIQRGYLTDKHHFDNLPLERRK